MGMHSRIVAADASKWTFNNSDRIWLDGVEHIFLYSDAAGHEFVLRDQPKIHVTVSDEELQDLMDRKKLRTIPFGHLKPAEWRKANVHATGFMDLAKNVQRQALWRKHWCDAILQLEHESKVSRSDASIISVTPRIGMAWHASDELAHKSAGDKTVQNFRTPAPSTVRRWLRRYEAAHFEVVALCDARGRSGNDTPRLNPTVQRFVAKYALRYAKRTQPSVAQVYGDLRAKIQEWNRLVTLWNERRPRKDHRQQLRTPSRSTLERAIRKLGEFVILAGRFGDEYARRKLSIVQGGLDVTRPLERVETDCWKIPLQVIMQRHPIWKELNDQQRVAVEKQSKRVWLDTIICAATRVVLAARILKQPSAAGKVETIAMSLVDKEQYARWAGCENSWDYAGTFESFAADTGSENLNEIVQGTIVDLTSTSCLMPVKQPQLRGRQERFYRTISNGLVAGLSGYSFENVVAKGDYDSQANAIIDLEELGRLIVRWIVDVYHRTPHAGLGGATPHDTWVDLRRKFRVLPPPDADRMRHITGISLERQIGGSGIRVLGLTYQSEPLQRLRFKVGTKPVQVRLDRMDIGAISVLGEDGWITVPCKRAKFAGVPLFQWILAAAKQRETNAAAAALHEESVLRALRDIEYFANAATARAGIASPILTWRAFADLERKIFKSFRFTDEGVGMTDVLASRDDDLEVPGPASETETEVVPMLPPPAEDAADQDFGARPAPKFLMED